jgi:hypothetical protein
MHGQALRAWAWCEAPLRASPPQRAPRPLAVNSTRTRTGWRALRRLLAPHSAAQPQGSALRSLAQRLLVTDARTTGALAASISTAFASSAACLLSPQTSASPLRALPRPIASNFYTPHPLTASNAAISVAPPASLRSAPPANSIPSIGIASLNRCSFPISAATRAGTGLERRPTSPAANNRAAHAFGAP